MFHKSLILHILGFVIYRMTAKDSILYQTNPMTVVYFLESFYPLCEVRSRHTYDIFIINCLKPTQKSIASKPSTFILYLFRV